MSGMIRSNILRKHIGEIARLMTKQDMIDMSIQIYEELKEDICLANKTAGKDYITYIPERKCGKSYSIVKLAGEYGLTIIARDEKIKKLLLKEAKTQGININVVTYIGVPRYLDGCSNTVLKEELLNIDKLRYKLNNNGFKQINVVGIN